ncbi:MAG: hypothetical protein LBG57_04615, partial [Treponema sp.]|nr:hypothetical protein [Treponema sp.]
HFQFQLPFQKLRTTLHHSFRGPFAFDVNVTIIRIPDKLMLNAPENRIKNAGEYRPPRHCK